MRQIILIIFSAHALNCQDIRSPLSQLLCREWQKEREGERERTVNKNRQALLNPNALVFSIHSRLSFILSACIYLAPVAWFSGFHFPACRNINQCYRTPLTRSYTYIYILRRRREQSGIEDKQNTITVFQYGNHGWITGFDP